MAVNIYNEEGEAQVLLICEHASNYIPDKYAKLGLSDEILDSHIAWDPGAFDIACQLSDLLDAKLVYCDVSRLIYDCNRPPDAHDAIPEKSEVYKIPGNSQLTEEQKNERINNIYLPFHECISTTLSKFSSPPVLITIHSFSPIYFGSFRDVELGILYDVDKRFADTLIANISNITDMKTERNQPYGPSDGVTHTLKLHGINNKILNVMLEVRNDLIQTLSQKKHVSAVLSEAIAKSLSGNSLESLQGG